MSGNHLTATYGLDTTPAQKDWNRYARWQDRQFKQMERDAKRVRVMDNLSGGVGFLQKAAKLGVGVVALKGTFGLINKSMEQFGKTGELAAKRVENSMFNLRKTSESLRSTIGALFVEVGDDIGAFFGGESRDAKVLRLQAAVDAEERKRVDEVLRVRRQAAISAEYQRDKPRYINRLLEIETERRATMALRPKELLGKAKPTLGAIGYRYEDVRDITPDQREFDSAVSREFFAKADVVMRDAIGDWIKGKVDAFEKWGKDNRAKIERSSKQREAATLKRREAQDRTSDMLSDLEAGTLSDLGRDREATLMRLRSDKEKALREFDQGPLSGDRGLRSKIERAHQRRIDSAANPQEDNQRQVRTVAIGAGVGGIPGLSAAVFGGSPKTKPATEDTARQMLAMLKHVADRMSRFGLA